jgi:hypothetical protein
MLWKRFENKELEDPTVCAELKRELNCEYYPLF